MKVKFFSAGLLAGIFALLAACAAAHALTMTQTLSFDLSAPTVAFQVTNDDGTVTTVPTNLPVPPGTDSQTLSFTKFDTTLGNLTGVTITFTTTQYSATVTVQADNGGFAESTFFSDATMDRLLSGALILGAPSQQTFSASCLAPTSQTNSCNDSTTDTTDFSGTAGLAGAPSTFNAPPATFDLTVALSSTLAPRVTPDNGTSFAGDSTFSGALNANWKGDVSVVYTYDAPVTAVPEPLSLYLLIAGLGGIALSQRRRR
jgi:hypothetical protein